MVERRYRLIEHTADAGVEAEGATLEEAFAAAAEGMFAVIADCRAVRPARTWSVRATAPDLPLLLHAFLEEILFLHLTRRVLAARVEVRRLRPPAPGRPAAIWSRLAGEPVDPARHELRVEIKAVTLHGLAVEPAGAGWRARAIFDL